MIEIYENVHKKTHYFRLFRKSFAFAMNRDLGEQNIVKNIICNLIYNQNVKNYIRNTLLLINLKRTISSLFHNYIYHRIS